MDANQLMRFRSYTGTFGKRFSVPFRLTRAIARARVGTRVNRITREYTQRETLNQARRSKFLKVRNRSPVPR